MHIGDRIRLRRDELGIKQVDLAKRLGIPAQSLWRIEAGQVESPRVELVDKIAAELGLSLDYLIRGEAPEPTPPSSQSGEHPAVEPSQSDAAAER